MEIWFLVAATFLLAGLVKGAIGMGLPTIAMGLLSLGMPPAQAAAVLIVPSTVTNIWQLLAGPAFGPLVRRLWRMMACVVVGTFLTSGVLAGDAAGVATVALGSALIAYALVGLAGLSFSVRPAEERWLSPLVGFATGLVTGATGVFVLPAVPYLHAIGLDKDELVQALGLSFTVSTLALAAALLPHIAPAGELGWLSVASVAISIAGMMLGQAVRQRLAGPAFRWTFFAGLLVLGVYLAFR